MRVCTRYHHVCTLCVHHSTYAPQRGSSPKSVCLLYLPLTPMSVVFVHSRQDEQKSNQKSTALKGDILTMSGDPSKGNHPWSKREPYLTSRSAPPAGAFKETALEGNRRRRKRKKKLGGICSHRSTLCTWVPTVWSTETTKNGAVELV